MKIPTFYSGVYTKWEGEIGWVKLGEQPLQEKKSLYVLRVESNLIRLGTKKYEEIEGCVTYDIYT